jgi:hypothetical protein
MSDSANCGGCGNACTAGMACANGVCIVPAPRQLAPLSGSTATSSRPSLRWAGTRAHIDVCADRACSVVEQTGDELGSSFVPSNPLPRGIHFWRLRAIDGTVVGPTWEFWVGAQVAAVNVSCGTTLDVNGDGFADVVVNNPQITHDAWVSVRKRTERWEWTACCSTAVDPQGSRTLHR